MRNSFKTIIIMLMMGLIFACQPKQKDAEKGKTEKT